MEREDAVELAIAVGGVGLFVVALAAVGAAYGVNDTTFDGSVDGTATVTVDGEAVTGTVVGDLSGDLEDTSGGAFNGTLDGRIVASGAGLNASIQGPVDGTLTDPPNGTIEGTFDGSVGNESTDGTVEGATTGSISQNRAISFTGRLPLLGAIALFILAMGGSGFWLAERGDED